MLGERHTQPVDRSPGGAVDGIEAVRTPLDHQPPTFDCAATRSSTRASTGSR